jgi:hypothetical protein
MKQLSVGEMEKLSQSATPFAPVNRSARPNYRVSSGKGAGINSSVGKPSLGFWVVGAAIRALWLKV